MINIEEKRKTIESADLSPQEEWWERNLLEAYEEIGALKQQRDDLLTVYKKGVAPFSLSLYAERFRKLASKPNLAVYRGILGNAAGMFEILESEAKNREAAIVKCEKEPA